MDKTHWQVVVEALGLTVETEGAQAYGPCPIHGGDNAGSFRVGEGDDGWPTLYCNTGCDDSRFKASKRKRLKWYRRARANLVKAHPELEAHLAPAGGKVKPATKTATNTKPLPDNASIAKWHSALLSSTRKQERKAFLKRRGLGKETLIDYEIGWFYNRFTIPIRDRAGRIVNVRKYAPDDRNKMIGVTGHNASFVYPLVALEDYADDEPIVWCEGELDALTCLRHGILALTGTGGAATPPQDLSALEDRVVYLAFDADKAGRAGERKMGARLDGIAKQVKVIRIEDAGIPYQQEHGADLTDWFTTHKKTANELRALMDDAPVFDPIDSVPDTEVVWLSDVEEKPLHWLWAGRVPYGKLTVLDGDPGLGKSTIWVDIASRVTTGDPFPGGDGEIRQPGKALIVAGEDDLSDTIVPRLKAAGADLNRIGAFKLSRDEEGNLLPMTLPEDLERIRAMLIKNEFTLLVIDPIMAYLSETIQSHNDAAVRRALTPLADVLQETGTAGLVVRHLNKNADVGAMYRGGGSIAFIGAARSGLVVTKHPDDPEWSVMAQVKTNLSRKAATIAYRVQKLSDDENTADTYIEWGDQLDVTADDLFAKKDGRKHSPARDEAVVFLRAVLSDGPQKAADVKKQAEAAGITWATLKNAKAHVEGLDVYPVRKGGVVQHWIWSTGPAVEVKKRKHKGKG